MSFPLYSFSEICHCQHLPPHETDTSDPHPPENLHLCSRLYAKLNHDMKMPPHPSSPPLQESDTDHTAIRIPLSIHPRMLHVPMSKGYGSLRQSCLFNPNFLTKIALLVVIIEHVCLTSRCNPSSALLLAVRSHKILLLSPCNAKNRCASFVAGSPSQWSEMDHPS